MVRHEPTINSFENMRQRCNNPKHHRFYLYGARGISVCKEWSTYNNFVKDMGLRPEGKTLDRINSDGNYEKDNCRWATPRDQANNTNRNVFYRVNGETDTLANHCRKYGLKYQFAYNKLYWGKYTLDQVISNWGTNGAE